MKPSFLKIFPLLALLLAHCGGGATGGTEAGNPPDLPTRNVLGLINSIESALVKSATTCPADTVIATDALAQTTEGIIESDCSFTLPLSTGKAYALSMVNDGTFIASFLFDNSASLLQSPTFIISSGSDDIDLGNITILDGEAFPTLNPAQQNDQDGDGIHDYDDDDDDNDDIADDSEEDCDLDGYFDDYDDDVCDESEDSEDLAIALEVSPQSGKTDVSLDRDIEVRFGCTVNPAFVNASTFSLASASNVAVICTYEIDENEVNCEHNNFNSATRYTVTLNGLKCLSGDSIQGVTWSFTTRNN